MAKLSKERQAHIDLIEAGKRSLADGEKWVIGHAEGLLPQTASDDLAHPVRVLCEATGLDWDEAQESGFYLTRAVLQQESNQ